jgi:IS5 family transposase
VIDVVVPWQGLEALIEPHYPKAGSGRPPVGLSIMLRIYFLQQWFHLSDPGAKDALYESPVLRRSPGRRRSFASAACWRHTRCAARFWTR